MAVIVGIDGSDHARRALTWAAHEARLRAEELLLVHAYASPIVYFPYAELPGGPDPQVGADAQRSADELLAHEVEHMADALAGIEVGTASVEDPQAARALSERAGPWDLLVVGSRGRGGFQGLLLGSVSQQLAQHAPCPVVVVPPQA